MELNFEKIEENSRFLIARGIKMMVQVHIPNNKPKAAACLVPDLLNDNAAYENDIEDLLKHDFTVYQLIFSKGGLESKTRESIKSLSALLDVMQELIICTRKDHNDLPIVGLGYATGASALLCYTLKNPSHEIDCIIARYPVITEDKIDKSTLRSLFGMKKLSPQFRKSIPTDISNAAHQNLMIALNQASRLISRLLPEAQFSIVLEGVNYTGTSSKITKVEKLSGSPADCFVGMLHLSPQSY